MAYTRPKIITNHAAVRCLYFDDGNQWKPLSNWTEFFTDLGAAAAAPKITGQRFVIAAALPTRSYAAALTGLGVVVFRASSNDHVDPSEYFAQLCQLNIGTPVSVIKDGRKLKGRYVGKDGNWIKIQVEERSQTDSGALTRFVGEAEALNVEVLQDTLVTLPKRQTGKLVHAMTPFASEFISNDAVFARESKLECLIIGSKSLLRQEVETPLAITRDGSRFNEGALQDVLRIRSFMNEGEAFRSEVFAYGSRVPPIATRYQSPHVVIFDSAKSFLRWRGHLRKLNWIVLLDRTETKFTDAAVVINQDRMKYKISETPVADVPAPPAGVEIVSYYERLH